MASFGRKGKGKEGSPQCNLWGTRGKKNSNPASSGGKKVKAPRWSLTSASRNSVKKGRGGGLCPQKERARWLLCRRTRTIEETGPAARKKRVRQGKKRCYGGGADVKGI